MNSFLDYPVYLNSLTVPRPDSAKIKNRIIPTVPKRRSSGLNAWFDRLAEKSTFAQGLHNIVILPSRRRPLKDT